MHRYIHEQNLAHYRKVLSETTDPTKRQTLLKLLADEQANVRPLTETEPRPNDIDVDQFADCGSRYEVAWRTSYFDAPEPA